MVDRSDSLGLAGAMAIEAPTATSVFGEFRSVATIFANGGAAQEQPFHPALEALETGRQIAENTGSKRALWSLLPTLIDAYQGQGDLHRAHSTQQEARELMNFLQGRIEDDALKAKFQSKFENLLGDR